MKLINFANSNTFNELRRHMDADLISIDSIAWKNIDDKDLLKRLNSIEGIEVSIEEGVNGDRIS